MGSWYFWKTLLLSFYYNNTKLIDLFFVPNILNNYFTKTFILFVMQKKCTTQIKIGIAKKSEGIKI